MDEGSADAAGRTALRSRLELIPGADHRPVRHDSDRDRAAGAGGHHRLQRHQPAHWRGLRRVRQRQDVAEGECRSLPASGLEPGALHQRQPVRARVDDHQPARGRTTTGTSCRIATSWTVEPQSPATTGSIDTCGAWADPNFGRARPSTTLDPTPFSVDGARGRTTGSSACRCSRRSCRGSRSKSATTVGGGRSSRRRRRDRQRSRQRGGLLAVRCHRAGRFASCRMAADTWSLASTTSRRQAFAARRQENVQTRRTTSATTSATGTASTSPRRRGCGTG